MTYRAINSYSDFLRRRYGHDLYRVPVDLGLGCPNRNPDGTGGCVFCAEDGGRAPQLGDAVSLREQVGRGVTFARQRYGARGLLLYVQAYTGTFADPEHQESLFRELLDAYPFEAISVGTRPDCLPDETIELLVRLRDRVDVWVELGLQTSHDDTLRCMGRGHTWRDAVDAVRRLDEAGLCVAAHVILGFPGENRRLYRQTARRLADLPLSGIKIHNLHVLEGTALAEQYRRKPFPVFGEQEYADVLIDFLRHLPPDLPVMRLTTDSPAEKLIAPRWEMSKGQFLEHVDRLMRLLSVRQGDRYGTDGAGREKDYRPVLTGDGSVTFWSPEFKEHCHCRAGARSEALAKFIEPSRLEERLMAGDVALLDVCFGLGYNTLCAGALAERVRNGNLTVTALEIDRDLVAAASSAVSTPVSSSFDWGECLATLVHGGRFQSGRFGAELLWGDARFTVSRLCSRAFDAIFLDAFSTQRNPELWTFDFLSLLASMLTPDGVLVTYCAALPVRSAFMKAGLHVGETSPMGRKRGGTIAARSAELIECPLPAAEKVTIQTTSRGLPYRDPSRAWSAKRILRDREERVRAVKAGGSACGKS